ncbi:Protease 1 [bacterium HR30]|nr:Protease 1 [bacterium HR30]
MKGMLIGSLALSLLAWGCTKGCERKSDNAAPPAIAPQAEQKAPAGAGEAMTEEDCVVLIDADPDYGPPPLSVSFTSEVECTGGEAQYKWDFGDGSTSTEPNPVHTYTKVGEYTATLTVTAGEVSASDEIDITVEEEEPAEPQGSD